MRIVTGVVIIAAAMLIAVGGLMLVQRLFSTEQRRQHEYTRSWWGRWR